jgi:hypothetical protein
LTIDFFRSLNLSGLMSLPSLIQDGIDVCHKAPLATWNLVMWKEPRVDSRL